VKKRERANACARRAHDAGWTPSWGRRDDRALAGVRPPRRGDAGVRRRSRSAASGEPIELRDLYLRQGARLSKALVSLSDALANRRDRGRRFVTVEHVHVHAGGQAIVGAVTSPAAVK
jgi:hypothetical protein